VLLADVNVFVYAYRPDHPQHPAASRWLSERLTGDERFGVSELVVSGFVRVVTNRRIYDEPANPEAALAFCERLLAAPSVTSVRPGPDHFGIFTRLCREVGARANIVPDAYHAALAIEHGATWVTSDRGFARFPGLRWQTLPLSSSS
jgi:uncharacterized protein